MIISLEDPVTVRLTAEGREVWRRHAIAILGMSTAWADREVGKNGRFTAPLRTVMVVFGAHLWGAMGAPFEGGIEV